jgi:micrococcal nuclease
MMPTTTRHLALVGALLLAASCAAVDDLTDLAENTTPAPAEATTSPEPPSTAALPQETATVVRIIDGDTFDVRFTDGRTERIRPPQFDAPERGECWHGEATDLLEELIGGREVRLVPLSDGPDRDRHARLLRAVEIDGRDVGALMLEAGAAHWLDRYVHEDARLAAMYQAAEQHARANKIGAWALCPDWP